ncbi:hypothetical protein BDZ45DRAFT_107466 [Acephala macrosclerotiorum]|nr:hypothetical protein BDZ45DRAFT_107466 [Acephala macrosclerotiorum]
MEIRLSRIGNSKAAFPVSPVWTFSGCSKGRQLGWGFRPIDFLEGEEGGPENQGQARMLKIVERRFSGFQEPRNPGNGKQERNVRSLQSNGSIKQGSACMLQVKSEILAPNKRSLGRSHPHPRRLSNESCSRVLRQRRESMQRR